MAGRSNPSRPGEQTLLLRRSLAHAVTLRRNTFTAIMVKNKLNYSARFARRLFKLIIVLKDRSRLNTSARTASTPYSAGKHGCTSLFTSAATIIARIASTLSKNLTRRNRPCKKINLRNSNSVISTANIYSRPKNLTIPLRLNLSSILQKSITLKTFLA